MADAFSLSQSLDRAALAARFARHGRVEIAGLLQAGQAETLRAHLAARTDWVLVLNAGVRVYEIPRREWATLGAAARAELDALVVAAGREGFQYRYESIRVADDAAARTADDSLLARFVAFLSAPPVLDLIAAITTARDLAFADGQATAYSSGHFLTCHDDDITGKHRRSAYVFGLAPGWRTEWGGLLMFHRADGNIAEAYVPAMGALRLFGVPTDHSVSYVTPFAPEPRFSVTGWFRSQKPDAA